MHREATRSILGLGLAIVATACPREQDEPPSNDTTGQKTTAGNDVAGGTTEAVTTVSTMMADSSGGSTEESGGEDCEGPDGCYSCAPTTPAQVLDACTDATCEAFPNTARRLPRLERDGSLPPIP